VRAVCGGGLLEHAEPVLHLAEACGEVIHDGAKRLAVGNGVRTLHRQLRAERLELVRNRSTLQLGNMRIRGARARTHRCGLVVRGLERGLVIEQRGHDRVKHVLHILEVDRAADQRRECARHPRRYSPIVRHRPVRVMQYQNGLLYLLLARREVVQLRRAARGSR